MIRLFSLFKLGLMASVLIVSVASNAQVLNSTQRDRVVATSLSAPNIDATAWALMEVNTGWVVAGKNTRLPIAPASITKLMMNYVVFTKLKSGDINFTDQVSISEKAWRAEGSRMFADVNTRIELKHLLKSTVIQSGNDAAIALAEYVGGSEHAFAQLMNQAANDLGLEDSHFNNSSGLPAKKKPVTSQLNNQAADEAEVSNDLGLPEQPHVMSASDIAALSAAIIKQYPDFYEWYSEKEYTHNNIRQFNRNKLLWKDSSVDGLKTGFTDAAGYCLVGSAKRNGQRWIAVVLGAKGEREREQAVLSLLNYAFSAYKPLSMLDKQGGLASASVYGGEVDEVRLQAVHSANIVVPKGRESDIVTELQFSPYFEAPVKLGQPMGVASLSLDGQSLIDVPLVAMSEIKEGSLWKRFIDTIKLRFK